MICSECQWTHEHRHHVWSKPDLTHIDWTAPATDLMDDLMEAWYCAHGDTEHERMADAEAWAERQFARYAR